MPLGAESPEPVTNTTGSPLRMVRASSRRADSPVFSAGSVLLRKRSKAPSLLLLVVALAVLLLMTSTRRCL